MKNSKNAMPDDLRRHIGEIYDGSAWEQIGARYFPTDGDPFEVYSFERDVEFEGALWRCVIITKWVLDADDPEEIDYTEDVIADAWKI